MKTPGNKYTVTTLSSVGGRRLQSPDRVDAVSDGEILTEEMLEELRSAPSVEDYLARHSLNTPSLSDYLNAQLQKHGLRRVDVVREADIEQTFGWYIFKGERGAGRDTVLKLACAMGLNAREANRALQAAGANTLYAKNRRDAIIIYCLEHGCALQQVNEVLYGFGEDCLQ